MKRSRHSMMRGALTALFLVAMLPAESVAQEDHSGHGYALRIGDHVEIELFTSGGVEVTVVAGERIIDVNGDVFLPYVGTVRVLGMDQSELRVFLTELYADFYSEPVVDVQVTLNVSVTGAVGAASRLFLPPTTTILDAIAEAGGMSPELNPGGLPFIPSDQSRVRLVRDGETRVLNLRPDEIVDSILHMPIQSGDWIHVPTQSRSAVRDEIQFWGGILGFVSNILFLVFVIGGN